MDMIMRKTRMMISKIKIEYIVIAILSLIITLFTDKVVFAEVDYLSAKTYYGIKLMNLVALFLFWQLVPVVCRRLKEKDEKLTLFIKSTAIYFMFMMAVLVLTWPGIWRWDELNIFFDAARLKILFFQYWYTSIFYMFCLGVFAFPAGILIVQIFIISLIVGYIVSEVRCITASKKAYLLYIVFLLPAVIDANLYPMRSSLVAFLVLYLFSTILFSYIKKSKPTYLLMIFWGIFSAICACWRSENITLLSIVPIIIYIAFKKCLSVKKICCMLVAITMIVIPSNVIQKRNGRSDYYSLSGMMEPMAAIVSTDFRSDNKSEDLKKLDAIISIQPVIEQKSAGGVYWSEGMKPHTKEQMSAFKRTYVKLILNNPTTFLKDRFTYFFKTCGIIDGGVQFIAPPDLRREYLSQYNLDKYNRFRDNTPANKFINEKLRMDLISIINCREIDEYGQKTPLNYLIYNPLIPIVLLLYVLVSSVVRKKYIWSAISIASLALPAAVFLTAPMTHFFYYYSVYLCGYVFLIMYLLLANDTDKQLS